MLMLIFYQNVAMTAPTATIFCSNISITLCAMDLPRIIHSDQSCKFESAILHQTLQAFGVTSHTQQDITHRDIK